MSERDAEYTADQPAADPAQRLTDADIAWYRAEHTPDLVKAHDGSEAMECAWCEDSPWPCSIIDMVNEVVELRIDLTKTRRERDTTRRANGEMAAALRAKLSALAEWTCDEGGWRLFYYSTPPPEGIFNLTDRFNPDVDPALAALQSERPAAPAAPSAEASDSPWIRRGFSATSHGRSWPYVTCLDCGWLTYTDSPTVVHHTIDCPHATTPPVAPSAEE